MAGDFWAKYKHPKWQEKRLRIMQAASFMCDHCQDDEATLNVHHTYYTSGAEPWDYPDWSLRCLCEKCHKEAEVLKREILESIGTLPPDMAHFVLGLCRGLRMRMCPSNEYPIETGEIATGMLLAWAISDVHGTPALNELAKNNQTVTGEQVAEVASNQEPVA